MLRYIERGILPCPYIAVCTSEQAFVCEMKRVGTSLVPWIREGSDARTHLIVHDGVTRVIVCVRPVDGIEFTALLAHEAVHVKQYLLEMMDEKSPGDEIEAYMVQGIVLNLLLALSPRRTWKK